MNTFLILLTLTFKLTARFKEFGQHHYYFNKGKPKSLVIGQVCLVFLDNEEQAHVLSNSTVEVS